MRLFISVVFQLLLLGVANAQQIRLITYNIRYDHQQPGENSWKNRSAAMCELLQFYEPAILGVQEAMPHQLKDLDSALTNHVYLGVGRDFGDQRGEFCAIIYDTLQFSLINSGTFWLSDTPEVPSKAWDAAFPRICTWAIVSHAHSNQQLLVLNTHFDHMGVEARNRSSKLLISKLQEINRDNLPVVLMGDFNAKPNDDPINILKKYLQDARDKSQKRPYGPSGTFNGFSNEPITDRIDYFFVNELPQVTSYVHINDRMQNEGHISDHLPVMMDITLRD